MQHFELKMLPWNVVFGAGCLASLPSRMDQLGLKRALVLSSPEQVSDAANVAEIIGSRAVGRFTEAKMHVPIATAEAAKELALAHHSDCTISVGGGSTTGLGKALALKAKLPLIAIPTTYAGSEMTSIWGITEDGRKQTGRDLKVLPVLTLYDAELSLGLPPKVAGPSGMNALAQAIINAKDPRSNPVILTLALQAVSAISNALPMVMAEPSNLGAREQLLYGAALAGASLGAGVTSLHHRLCHTLGGTYNTPHAETHAILLPYSVAYAAPAVPELMRGIADALHCDEAANGIYQLAKGIGLATSLSSIGITAAELPRIAELATEAAIVNPRPVTRAGVLALLNQALAGDAPTAIP